MAWLVPSSGLHNRNNKWFSKFRLKTANIPKQLTIDVGATPNHVVRVFEVRYTFSDNPPVINGLTLVEEWDRGFGNRLDDSGPATIYTVYVMENGHNFFVRNIGVVQNTAG
jgi:hypothetical protein